LKIKVIINQIKVKILQIAQKVGMKIPIWDLRQIPKELEWRCSNREKSIIFGCFSRIFENFKGEKGIPDHQSIWGITIFG
jgi:hypothetical protein